MKRKRWEAKALAFVDRLQTRIRAKLATFPLSGPEIGVYRYMVLDNYVAIYRVDEHKEDVVVMVVTEGHRNWRKVLGE